MLEDDDDDDDTNDDDANEVVVTVSNNGFEAALAGMEVRAHKPPPTHPHTCPDKSD